MEDEALGLDEAFAEALTHGFAQFVKFLGVSKLVRMLLPGNRRKLSWKGRVSHRMLGLTPGVFCPIRLRTPFKHHMARCQG